MEHITKQLFESSVAKQLPFIYYIFLYERYQRKCVIGPMLRIDDIPNYYPKKDQVQRAHGNCWRIKTTIVEWKGDKYHITPQLLILPFNLLVATTNINYIQVMQSDVVPRTQHVI